VNAPHLFKPNGADISAHLHALFPPAFVHSWPDAQIEIVYGPPGVFTDSRWYPAFDLKVIIDYVKVRSACGDNVYVGAALRHGSIPESGRANAEQNYLAAQYAWCEYDGAADHERIVAICKDKQLEPAIIVTTGTNPHLRQHLYFRIQGGIVITREQTAVNQVLRDLLGTDDVKDPIRIMRLGGCINYPTEKKRRERGYVAELVTVKIAQQPREYSIEELMALRPTQPQQHAQYDFSHAERQSSLGFKYARSNDDIWELLQKSKTPGHWHNSIRDAIATMVGRGWSDDAIRFTCAPYCDAGKDDPDLNRLIDGGRRKWDKPNPDDASATEASDANRPSADPVDLWAKFDPPTLPRGILPAVIEQFAFEQGMDMGADMAGIAVSALAVCAAAIPDNIKLQVKRHNKSWLESARIWVSLVGSPSSKKSPILSAAVSPLRKIDAEMARQYAERKSRYDKLDKDEKAKTEAPKQTRLLLQDTTIEAAQDILKDSPNGVLCFQDELSGWFGSMDKYSNARGAAKDRAFWLEAFNGAPYSVHRVGRGSVFKEKRKKVNKLAEKLVECAIEDKQSWAFQQIADRLEGKPVQVVDATADDHRAVHEFSDAELTAMLRRRVGVVLVDEERPEDGALN
jgi:hypothetical protein